MNKQILLDCICIVLCQTSHPGNIGAAARAMKTMGINDLRLVSPKKFPDPEADARSTGALDILQKCQIFDTFQEATSDCSLIAGLTARSRDLGPKRLQARAAANNISKCLNQQLALKSTEKLMPKIAIVFGNETNGLSNADIQSCNIAIEIPTIKEFSSLNLGSAVQIMAYECRMAAFNENPPEIGFATENSSPQANANEVENMLKHWEQTMIDCQFLDQNQPKRIMAKVKRMFLRNNLQRDEVNLLRGFLSQLNKYLS